MAIQYFTDDNIAPKSYLVLSDKDNNRLSLRVKRKISTSRNFKINEQEMYSNNTINHTTSFNHNGSDGLTFKVTILFKKDEVDQLKQLDAWYREMRPFKIAFDVDLSLNLPLVSKDWIVKDVSIDQEDKSYTSWDVTFRTYNPPKQITAIKNNLVNRTAKSYKWEHQCKKTYKDLTYKKMKKKKGNNGAKLLNEILIELSYMSKSVKKVKTKKKDKKGKPIYKKTKYVPDKCTKKTSKAVKKFKKKWNEHKLKPKIAKKGKSYTDVIDANTYKALCNYKELKNAKKKK